MTESVKRLETLHIPLWLLKDICWVMVWRPLGFFMIIPTLSVAIAISYKTVKSSEFYINLAICFWISANSFWMCAEFLGFEQYKSFALIPFVIGLIISAYYFFRKPGKEDTTQLF